MRRFVPALALVLLIVSSTSGLAQPRGLVMAAAGQATTTVMGAGGGTSCEDPSTPVTITGDAALGNILVAYAGTCRAGYTLFDLDRDCPEADLSGEVRCEGVAEPINVEETFHLSLTVRADGAMRLSVVTASDGTNMTVAGELVRF